MKKVLIILCVLLSVLCCGQDRIFLRSGSVKSGTLVSQATDFIFFREYANALPQRILKDSIYILEMANGSRFLYAGKKGNNEPEHSTQKKHIVSVSPFGLLAGRAVAVYEHLWPSADIGIALPVTLTFDPFGTVLAPRLDTAGGGRLKGTGLIAGIDLNYYPGTGERTKFFIGPRFRYGTDFLLRKVTGLTLQTQLGWRFDARNSALTQHVAIGFGFVRIFESPAGPLIDAGQSYSWYSLTYRVGIRW